MNRSELREIIMKCLYQIFVLKNSGLEYDKNSIIKEQIEVENEFVKNTINEIIEREEEIRELANKYLINWDLNRLNLVDQMILMMGIYELNMTDTPSVVAINEAIELAKKYSDEDVVKMINGVLDNIYHSEDHYE